MLKGVSALMLVLLTIAAFALIGREIAKARGIRPIVGLALGGMVPLVGIGILLLIERRKQGVES